MGAGFQGKIRFGVAVVMEGATERVFYQAYFRHACEKAGIELEETVVSDTPAMVMSHGDARALVLFQNMDSVTQMPNAGIWFNNVCVPVAPSAPWRVLLCYDTDEPNADVTKFYEGAWAELRKSIGRKAASVEDLAAQADIEDVILGDRAGVMAFLGLPGETPVPNSKKGKKKLRVLHRQAGLTYHSGIRAKGLIEALNLDMAAANAPEGVDLSCIDRLVAALIDEDDAS